jgi:hypothetical protein
MSFVPPGPTIPGTNIFKTLTCDLLQANVESESIITTSINMSGGTITNLGDPVNPTDAANKNYVDTHSGSGGNLTGPISAINSVTSITSQTGTGTTFAMSTGPTITNLSVGNTIITDVATPVSLTDAVNKNYVDSHPGSNLTGPISATNGVTSITSQTGTGTTFAMSTGPIFINPNIGSASGNSLLTTGNVAGNQLVSNVSTGTPPLIISSTTAVPNLKASSSSIADTVTTNANLTGPITSIGNATSVASQTGTGTTFVMNTTPVLITPHLGVATGTSLNATGSVSANQLISTVSTGTPPLSVTSTTVVPNLKAAKAGLADNVATNANLTGPITSVGNATSVASQTGTGTTFVMNIGPTVSNLSAGSTKITNVSTPISGTDAANKNYVDSLTQISQYTAIVQKNPGPGEFSTIEAALASITTSSATEPWVVNVGPGIYSENQLVIPDYVSVKGSSINPTVVSPNVPSQYLFIMGSITEISFMTLQGISGSVSPGPGAGFAAIYSTDIENFAQVHKVSIYDFDIGIDNYANTTFTTLYVEYTDVNGDYSYGVRNRSTSGFDAVIALEDFFSYPSTSVTKTAVLNDGIGTQIQVTGSTLYGGPGMMGIVAQNGGEIAIEGLLIRDFLSGGIISQNIGSGAVIKIDGTSFINCSPDFSINNVDTTGYFFGNSPRNNNFIINGSAFFIANQDSNIIKVAKTGGDYTSIVAALASITDASTTNPYIVSVGPGTFTEVPFTIQTGIALIGSSIKITTVVSSNNSSNFITCSGNTSIQNISITGPSISGAAIFYTGNALGLTVLIGSCIINSSNIGVYVHGTSTNIFQMDNCIFTGTFSSCIQIDNTGVVLTRTSLNNITYTNLTTPATYVCNVSGTNVNIEITDCTFVITPTNSSTGVYIGSGSAVNIVGSILSGFGKTIHVPVGSSNVILNGAGTQINNSVSYDLLIENSTTTGAWDGALIYTKTSIPITSTFYVYGKEATIITVQNSGGDFTSIVAALNSITNNSSVNRYVINVGPGTFTEATVVMKEYVNIHGTGRSTVIQPDSNNHHIIMGADYAELNGLIITGAGTGYAGLYHETPTGTNNTALICRSLLFGTNDIHVWTYGNVGQAHVILFNIRYGGTEQFNYGFRATNNNNSMNSKITIIGTTSQDFTSPLPKYICYASGTNCTISVNGFNIIHNGLVEANTVGFQVDNGGLIRVISTTIRGFDTAIQSINSGSVPQIVAAGCTITDCTTDLNINHPGTTGSISASVTRTKTVINGTPPLTLFLVDPANTGISFAGPFYYSKSNFSQITDISNLITDTPTMGLITGGMLSVSSGLILAIAAGTGYNNILSDNLMYQTWNSGTITIPANSNSYIFINSTGNFSQSASVPDTEFNILLGLVSTNGTDIIYIQQTPLVAHHWSNETDHMLRGAIGSVYASGSSVAELGTRQLTVSQGNYFFSNNEFLPSGASPAGFTIYYRSATPGIYTAIPSQITVPNTSYDDGSGVLQPLTASYYTKHLLLLLGGPAEVYALVYGQAEYSSQGSAESAGLPTVPSFVTDAFVRVASLVVQQGNTNIVSIIDERPRIGFASSSTTGVITIHGDLLGLAANDHPQYLLVNGDAPGMTGTLNMNSNPIINSGLINSVDIALHGSRHGLNSTDPIPTSTLSSDIANVSDTTASLGISNNVPRADHVHFHGNLSGGNLHAAVIASGASGFMTGTDKAKLNSIQSGATNTTASNNNPLNVTKSAASAGVSAEVSRYDHKHDIDTAAPITTLLTNTTNSEGTATSLSRSDHTHAVSSDVPVTLLPDQANAIGNSTAFARADHIHNVPTAIAAGLNANSTNQQGAASSFSRSNHTHAISSGVPSNQTIAASVQTGTSANFARADHIHTFSTDVPITITTTNSEGTSTSFARADHIHAHGAQTDGTLHASVIASGTSGFMTGTDKAKLDGIAPGATNTPLTNTAPVNVDKSAALVGVSTEAARADHKHDISTGVATGLSATTTNIEGTATTLSRSDHTHAISSGVPSNQTIAASVQTGTSANFARADHIHTFSTAAPNSVGSANTEGTSTSFSRADHVHNISLTGPITSSGTVTSVASQTGTGSTFVMNNGPTLITPVIGAATGTSLNVTGTLKSQTGVIIEDPSIGVNIITLQAPTGLPASYFWTYPTSGGNNGQLLATDGLGNLSWSNTGINVVTNSGTSTDTALARFSGTTGKVIQNSTVLLSGTGDLTGISTISMSGQLTSTVSTGTAPFVVSSTTQVANLTSTNSFNSNMIDDTTTNATMFPTWVTANSGFLPQKVTSSKLTFNPNSGLLASTAFGGSLSTCTGLPLTTGVTGILQPINGGTGINNGSNSLTLGGSLSTTGSFTSTFNMSGTTLVNFPTSGTLISNTSGSALTKTDDTNVTLTLGGSPSTALVNATSITAGWAGTLAPTRGGTGVNNGSNTLTLAGNLATSGAFASTFTMTGTTGVTFPTTGTLATTSQLPTPAALTKTDDTNITLTLGGTPATALLQAASITAGWSGTLAPTRGGTGVNNGSSTLTLGGNLATSGAFASTFTMTGTTGVTFPTTGTLATTSQLPTPAALTKTDDTNVTLTLGGTPATALLQASSITAGWTGTLSGTRGGTGVNNGASTITLGGSLTTSGAFASTFTMSGNTAVTFPPAGTIEAGTANTNTALQSQLTVAGTTYYVTSSNLLVPGTSLRIGSSANWTTSMTKTNVGTGTFSIKIFLGTNGTIADTAIVTQSIGTQTAAVDNMLLYVQVTFTAVGAGTGSLFWSITPMNKAVTATGFGCATGTLFNGTVSALTTTTSGLILGLGFVGQTGTPTVTVPLVKSELLI